MKAMIKLQLHYTVTGGEGFETARNGNRYYL